MTTPPTPGAADNHLLSSLASLYPRDDVVLSEVFRVINNFSGGSSCRSWMVGIGSGVVRIVLIILLKRYVTDPGIVSDLFKKWGWHLIRLVLYRNRQYPVKDYQALQLSTIGEAGRTINGLPLYVATVGDVVEVTHVPHFHTPYLTTLDQTATQRIQEDAAGVTKYFSWRATRYSLLQPQCLFPSRNYLRLQEIIEKKCVADIHLRSYDILGILIDGVPGLGKTRALEFLANNLGKRRIAESSNIHGTGGASSSRQDVGGASSSGQDVGSASSNGHTQSMMGDVGEGMGGSVVGHGGGFKTQIPKAYVTYRIDMSNFQVLKMTPEKIFEACFHQIAIRKPSIFMIDEVDKYIDYHIKHTYAELCKQTPKKKVDLLGEPDLIPTPTVISFEEHSVTVRTDFLYLILAILERVGNENTCVVIFCSNNFDTIFGDLDMTHFDSLKSRFTRVRFDLCDSAEIVDYMRYNNANFEFGDLYEPNLEQYLPQLHPNISITYRTLREISVLSAYDPRQMITSLNRLANPDTSTLIPSLNRLANPDTSTLIPFPSSLTSISSSSSSDHELSYPSPTNPSTGHELALSSSPSPSFPAVSYIGNLEQPDRIAVSIDEPDFELEAGGNVEKGAMSKDQPEMVDAVAPIVICQCKMLMINKCTCSDCQLFAPPGTGVSNLKCHWCVTGMIDPYALKTWKYESSNSVEPDRVWARILKMGNELEKLGQNSSDWYRAYLDIFEFINYDDVIHAFSALDRNINKIYSYPNAVITQIRGFMSYNSGLIFLRENADVLMSVYRKWLPIYKAHPPKSENRHPNTVLSKD